VLDLFDNLLFIFLDLILINLSSESQLELYDFFILYLYLIGDELVFAIFKLFRYLFCYPLYCAKI